MHLIVQAQHHRLSPAAVCGAFEIDHVITAAHLAAALVDATQAPALAPYGGGAGHAALLLPPRLTHFLAHSLA